MVIGIFKFGYFGSDVLAVLAEQGQLPQQFAAGITRLEQIGWLLQKNF